MRPFLICCLFLTVHVHAQTPEYSVSDTLTVSVASLPVETDRVERITFLGDTEQHLELRGGTEIDLPALAFVDATEEIYRGEVRLETTEILTSAAALLDQVTTNLENGDFLESRGMIDVRAFTPSGDTLRLAPGKEMSIGIPQRDTFDLNGFAIYAGTRRWGTTAWRRQTIAWAAETKLTYPIYHYERMTRTERLALQTQRDSFVEAQLERGRPPKVVSRQMRRMADRQRRRRRSTRRKRPFRYTRSGRDYAELKRRNILGNARWKYYADTTRNPVRRNFLRFRVPSLGLFNVDRPYRPLPNGARRNVIVHGDHPQLRLLLRDEFVVLSGQRRSDHTIFYDIPIRQAIRLVSLERRPGGRCRVGWLDATSGADGYAIREFREMAGTEVETFLDR